MNTTPFQHFINRSPWPNGLLLVVIACIAFLQGAEAVSPPPDGGYPGGNTAEGYLALGSLTTGSYNNAVGVYSLLSLTTGNFNTADGAGALLSNTADQNTATGAGALLSNTGGTDTQPWATLPAPIKTWAAATSILAQGWLMFLARATTATSKASLTKRLSAESRF